MLPLLLLFASCSTSITTPNFRFTTYSNAAHIEVTGPGISLEATGLNNSVPTRAAGSVVGTLGTAVTGALAAPTILK